MSEETNHQLAEKARRGDAPAFGELYRRTYPMVCLQVARILRNRSEADAIAQEAYTRAWEGISTLREPGAFLSYVRTIAIRLASETAGTWMRRAAEVNDAPDPRSPDPAKQAEGNELDAAMLEAIADFDSVQQEAVLLRLVEGLKYREIADRLGLSLGQAIGLAERGVAKVALRLAPFVREVSP